VCWHAILLEDVSTGQSKFINKEISCIIVYKHYVTDDIINGKLVTGYFLIIERILNKFRSQVFVQSF